MQAYITRVKLPDTVDGLLGDHELTAISVIATGLYGDISWNMPKRAMTGDVVFFQITLSSVDVATKVAKLLPEVEDRFDREEIEWTLEFVRENAGHLVSVGLIGGSPEVDEPSGHSHWKSRIYAPIVGIECFEPLRVVTPSPYTAWPEFTAYGPVVHRQFSSNRHYRRIIKDIKALGSELSPWFEDAHITPIEGTQALNKNTYLKYAASPDTSFMSEANLRNVFSNFLLRDLSDRRRLFEEVSVYKGGRRKGQVDNVILVRGMVVPVEIKQAISAEPKLDEQLEKYRAGDELRTNVRSLGRPQTDVVLVVDRDGIYATRGGVADIELMAERVGLTKAKIRIFRDRLAALTQSAER